MEFARLTGDHNRLHTDPEYAKGTAFGEPIAHGLPSSLWLWSLTR